MLRAFWFAVDLAHEAGENFPGTYLNEVSGTLGDEDLDAFHPTNRTGDLANKAIAGVGAAGDHASVDVCSDRNGRVIEYEGFEVFGEGVLSGLHECTVEGGADLKHDRALCAGLLCSGQRRVGRPLRLLR